MQGNYLSSCFIQLVSDTKISHATRVTVLWLEQPNCFYSVYRVTHCAERVLVNTRPLALGSVEDRDCCLMQELCSGGWLYPYGGIVASQRQSINAVVCPVHAAGVVILTSSAQGAICPGEEVFLTCTVTGGVLLEWSSTAFSPVVRFIGNDPVGRMVNRGIFTTTLISEAPNPTPPLADLTSTLRVTATPEAMLNGTVVTCGDQLNPMNITLTLAGGLTCMKVALNE